MNKQEAINQIKLLKARETFMSETIWVKQDDVIGIVHKIHEPQKVVVPKFVAEWYERNKDDINTALYRAIIGTYRKVNGENDDSPDTFEEWIVYEDNSILILVQMHLFGYEVEQEKLYTVEIPNPNDNEITVLERTANGVVLAQFGRHEDNWKKERVYCLTESEIKQDFEWAWDAGFYEPVEVE
ncbi:DUF1642 domain-containing protein [Streptococcus suis]|uniref:DUF1642 domain-containing protein n=1 Tax=Streptococcus suis TaxID=1307 RepID=UPI00195FCC9A|nr:DUF1642 domain-containing protein [Streptococcus suis]MBM7283244.1 DUF1642 domain-containing protein [Streptococcus suis]MCO8237393.1 DUF1642 domain-containing protein [Streptococcus suis]HEM3531980.1 DUF1642 domain-containing protein [Streptococcus suis]